MSTHDTTEEIHLDITDIFPFKVYAVIMGGLAGFLIYY